MAKHPKKRKPQRRSPANAASRPASAPQTEQKAPFSLVGILALVVMIAGILIASLYHKSLGCIIAIIGATINLVHASIRKNQTVATIVVYLIYVSLIFFYWLR